MTLAISALRIDKLVRRLAVSVTAGFLLLSPAAALADADSSKQYYEDALDWLKKGDFRAAVIQLRNALQQDADNYAARLLLGRLYLQSGNLAAAEQELDYVYRRKPSDEVEVYLGRTQLGLHQYREALSTVRETADDAQFATAKKTIRAEALFALSRLDEAEYIVSGLLAQDSTSVPANLLMARIKARQGDPDAADRHIDAALTAQPDMVEAYILRAQMALQARDLDRVLEVADKIIEVAPDDPRGKLIKAEALVRKSDLKAARDLLEAFLQKSPDAMPGLYLYARVLMLLNDYPAADAALEGLPEAVQRQPAASLIIGLVKYQLEQYTQAEEALERFVAAAGDEGREARRLLATIQLKTDRPLAALQTLAPLTGDTSGDVAAFQLSASAALRTGRLEKAQADLQRVVQIGSENDRRQANSFLQVLQTATTDEAGKLTLDPVAQGVLEALDLAQFGDSEGALAKAEELKAEQPDNTAVANLLARLYVSIGDLEKARAALAPVLARDPTDLGSIANMNRIDVSEGKFDAMEGRLRNALELEPSNEALILQLANFLANRDRRDAAIALLRQKAEEIPGSLAIRANLINISLRENNIAEARRWAGEAYRIGESTDANGLAVAAEAYLALQDYTAAAEAYAKLAEKQGQTPDVLLKLAQAQLLAGDEAASKATVERVLKDDPSNFAANRALISMLLGENDEAGAMTVAEKAGEASPALGAVLRAAIFRRTGQIDKAVAEMQNQLAASPSAGLVRETYSLLLEAGRRDEAADLVANWLGENPDDAGMLQLLSAHYIQDKEYRRAMALLERAYSMLPNNAVVLNNLAWLRYELKEDGALEMARRAYSMAPNAAAVADTLGWILMREGQVDEGLELLYAAAAEAPENVDIAYHLAFALNEAGKSQEAIAILERALANDTDEQTSTEREKAEHLLAELKQS